MLLGNGRALATGAMNERVESRPANVPNHAKQARADDAGEGDSGSPSRGEPRGDQNSPKHERPGCLAPRRHDYTRVLSAPRTLGGSASDAPSARLASLTQDTRWFRRRRRSDSSNNAAPLAASSTKPPRRFP